MDQTSKGLRVLAHGVLIFMSVTVLAPLLLMVVSSLTPEITLLNSGYTLFPKTFSFDAYHYLFVGAGGSILRSYIVTLIVTIVGTTCGLIMTALLGYALSIKELPFRRLLSFYVFFTMLFNGGLVPTYMMYTNIFQIKNSILALIIPSLLVSGFLVIISKSFFSTNIPEEVLEAARMDGAGEIRSFFQIVFPMSMPIIATLGLIIGLSYWNNWTNGLYYITNRDLYSVQQMMVEMVKNMQALQSGIMGADQSAEATKAIPSTALKLATAVMSALPIMIVYPIFQKYFVKGVTLGAVKG